MPRDKTASHEKIMEAAKKEFLEKGYEQASMKSVADAVGMTSAALYRHFVNKQDMFAALVQPAVDSVNAWTKEHVQASMDALEDEDFGQIWDFGNQSNDVGVILDVMYEQPEIFRLLLFRSAGTPYESWVHSIIEEATDRMMEFVAACKKDGYPAHEIDRNEMHLLVTAYLMALLEPIEHGYSKKDAEKYLRTMLEFFTPGWRWVTGV